MHSAIAASTCREIHGRYTGDAREMHGRCTGDTREIQALVALGHRGEHLDKGRYREM